MTYKSLNAEVPLLVVAATWFVSFLNVWLSTPQADVDFVTFLTFFLAEHLSLLWIFTLFDLYFEYAA